MKKPYRNALRSRAMIREAFISLLKEKPIDKITVVDIVQRSNLSRNTFYAHYQDVYAVLEEYQQEALDALAQALDTAAAEKQMSAPLALLLKAASFVTTHRESYCVLVKATSAGPFIARMRSMLISFIQARLDHVPVTDRQGLLVLIEVLCAGFVTLITQYLKEQSDLTPEDIATEIDRIYRAALPLYFREVSP